MLMMRWLLWLLGAQGRNGWALMLMMRWLLWLPGAQGSTDAHDALALVASGGSGKKRLGPDDAHDALALVAFWELREETAGPWCS